MARPADIEAQAPGAIIRLPPGPLARQRDSEGQRYRLMVAMVDLIGERGYGETTVANIIAAAGLSRHAFYQNFSNKKECMLATYDVVVAECAEQVALAYREHPEFPERAQAAIGAMLEFATASPAALRLMMVEIAAAGPEGVARRERLPDVFEELLRPVGLAAAPRPMVRAIIGGLAAVLRAHATSGDANGLSSIVSDLVAWVSCYRVAADLGLPATSDPIPTGLAGGRAPGTLAPDPPNSRRRGLPPGEGNISPSYVIQNQRERILDAVANLTTRDGYDALTCEAIAGAAAVSLQTFYKHFASKEDAFLVAYELGHGRSLASVAKARAGASSGREAFRAGIAALFNFLATEPAFAHMSLVDAFTATRRIAARRGRGAVAYREVFRPPTQKRRNATSEVVGEAVAGGLFELCFSYTAREQSASLPGTVAIAIYFALAPYIGTDAALDVARSEPSAPVV
jgi:AcrR family transcriptional regulator